VSGESTTAIDSVVVRTDPDRESELWVQRLRPGDPRRDETVAWLHEVLARIAYRELSRRRGLLEPTSGPELDDLAQQAADGAVLNILRKLDEFRGESRFTTWAYKFAIRRNLRSRLAESGHPVIDEDHM